ncbi:HWE histidine kinase domain-containing protein [Hansschlegelia sp.]|uniref:HWE histidine kinase domain-containing protein n=1 Tax=Hansschlegelia sp. TaxID=2041892 RepID=UPI002C3340E5|nr:HWE histidine kinase domain-containing protein [Hansschlegelia sp.]HVI28247.1 HWE histidine kinase domain-containing protein [Hansschlegelia sp.]
MFPEERESARHRTLNLLAVVRALAAASRPDESVEDHRRRFSRRLEALGRAESLLPGQDGEPSPALDQLVRGELRSWRLEEDGRVSLTGPTVALRPGAVRLLALALHELAANAVEHGALARDGGRLAIAWDRAGPDVLVDWREIHAATSAPRPPGFGRELIEEGLPHQLGAQVSYSLEPAGLVCRIVAPVAAD